MRAQPRIAWQNDGAELHLDKASDNSGLSLASTLTNATEGSERRAYTLPSRRLLLSPSASWARVRSRPNCEARASYWKGTKVGE